MSLSRAAIVDQLKEIVGADRVITDETVLKKNSIDRFRKFPDIHGIYTLPIPAAVVKLGSTEQVSRVLNFMNAHKINGVPRTGASATEGGLETVVENSVVLDGSAMNQIINIDIENMQATAQCGVPLEVLENALREKGYTTGHSPQSKPLAQMGGLVATRSIGQFSTLYGAIEDMVVGLEAVLADGTVTRIKNVPRRAAGPDIRHIIIGNEGALCYITEVTVKIFKFTPENNLFYGYILEDMKTGFNILREIMVEGYRPSIARLYDAEDGTQHFTHFADGKCVLIFMAEGNPRIAKVTGEGIAEIVARYSRARVMNGGVDAEKVIGISGHLLAPEVCIVVGASGAAALMAGVRNSKFVVAINHDASAAVFSQADVGVVDDWKVVLEALVTNIHADCQ